MLTLYWIRIRPYVSSSTELAPHLFGVQGHPLGCVAKSTNRVDFSEGLIRPMS